MGAEVYHELKRTLKGRGLATAVGDEGGFAPALDSNEAPLELLVTRDREPPATGPATRWRSASTRRRASSSATGRYELAGEGRSLSSDEMVDYWAAIADRYPVLSLEDGMAEGDWDGWRRLTDRVGDRLQLVGDDIFVTNPAILREGIERGVANSILIKLNQIGTLTETLDTIALAHEAGYRAVDLASLRRDRGHVHRRPRRRHRRRPDQDRRAGALRASGQVQPARADRGGARRRAPATPDARRWPWPDRPTASTILRTRR